MNKLVARLAALLLTIAAVAPAAAQLLPPLPGGSLVVTLNSPGQGTTVSGTIPVTASVSIVGALTVSRVEFFRNGNSIGSDAGAPYAVSWNTTSVGNGSHTLSAVAVDVLGVRWSSNSVTVNVANGPPPDTTAPSVSITSPANGATVSGTVSVQASASDNVGVASVQFRLDSANLGGADSSSPYSRSWNTTAVANGSHTLTAVARDAAGNTRTSSPVTVTVSNGPPPDTTAPSVSITSPANGATVSGTVSVMASASDNVGVVGVQFLVDGVVRADDTSAPYSVSWDTTTVGNGSHTLTAVARDAAGNTRVSSPATVSVSNGPPPDTIAPSVSISSPASGATISGTITVTASATDNVGVTGVQFLLDGAAAGPVLTVAPYEVPFDTTAVSNGTHTIAAQAIDAAGNLATSATITVTVANGSTGTVRFEETDPAVVATGTWSSIGPETAAFSGGTAGAANAAGATATFTFTGSSVSWVGLRCNVCGIATVSIDGGAPGTVDTAGLGAPDGSLASEVVFSASGLDPAVSHILVITVTGNTNSGGAYIVVDAFDVTGGGASSLTRIEQDNAAVSYAGDWALRDQANPIASGGTFSAANVAGATLTLSFTGTEVRWLGQRYERGGIARIFVDGIFQGEVDTYAASAVLGEVFRASGLSAGSHTLTIEVTGTSDPAAGNSWVIIDAFDVVTP